MRQVDSLEMLLPYSQDFHLVEVNVRDDSAMGNVRPSPWATRETIQRENLEGCQCQGPVGPRATTKPVRSHVPSQYRGRFETILMAVGCVLTAALPCPSERPIGKSIHPNTYRRVFFEGQDFVVKSKIDRNYENYYRETIKLLLSLKTSI